MKKRSLSALAITLFVFLSIIPVAFSLVFFTSSTSKRMKASAEETANYYLSQALERTELTMDTLGNIVYYMMSNNQVQELMQNSQMPEAIERHLVEDDLSRMLLYNAEWIQDSLNGVCILRDDQQMLTMFRGSAYAGVQQRIDIVYQRLKDKNSVRTLEVFDDYAGYAYCITDYIDLDTMKPLGKILFEILPSQLMRSDSFVSLYPGTEILLLNDRQQVLYASADSIHDDAQQIAVSVGNTVKWQADESSTYFLADNRCDQYQISAYMLIPYDKMFAPIHDIMLFYIAYVLAVLLLTLLIGLCFYRLLMRPLHRMVSTINQMADGDLSVRMQDSAYQETSHIIRAFNSMADHLEDLFDEVYDKGMLLRDAEFRLLESQISPHFIFNVLEAINMRCIVAGQPAISRMVTNLAQLLRANILHKSEPKITYEQELEYVQYYLELQKERFGDQLEYEISVEDESLLQYYLPKLTIQPLVENSVVHGLENKRGGGTVRVWIWEENDSIRVQVTDDGIGFDTASLHLAEEQDKSHNNVAINNIHRRIQLLYGKKYGLQIRSMPGKGTEATLIFPHDSSHT